MFNLSLIQKIITGISITVFFLTFIFVIGTATSNPNGILANAFGQKPITVFTTKNVNTYNYGEAISVFEDVKIIDKSSTIVSKNIEANLNSKTTLTANGLFYIKNTDAIRIALSSKIAVDLSKGEYIINTNPIKIYVLSGMVAYNSTEIANVNQSAIWLVDQFRVTALNTDDFVLNINYSQLITLLRDLELAPSVLTNLSFDLNTITNVIQVNQEEEIVNTNCENLSNTQSILCQINLYRIENNIDKLNSEESLELLAQSHSDWMSNNSSTATIESNGLSYKERCESINLSCLYELNYYIENTDAIAIFNTIKENSNLLDENAYYIGVGLSGNYLSILIR